MSARRGSLAMKTIFLHAPDLMYSAIARMSRRASFEGGIVGSKVSVETSWPMMTVELLMLAGDGVNERGVEGGR